MTDPFTAHWFNLYYLVLGNTNNKTLYDVAIQRFGTMCSKYENYIQVYEFFANMVKVCSKMFTCNPSFSIKGFTLISIFVMNN